MSKIRLSRASISGVFWNFLYSETNLLPNKFINTFCDFSKRLEGYKDGAMYKTGSISLESSLRLLRIGHFFKPKVIAEVGTFIGRSTFSLGFGSSFMNKGVEIHTCDSSNNIIFNESVDFKITQYPMNTSTHMFEVLIQNQLKVDLLNLDGRLTDRDILMFPNFVTQDTVVVLDDFEGIEKGVINAIKLLESEPFRRHTLIYPDSDINRTGGERSVIAVIVPLNRFLMTSQ